MIHNDVQNQLQLLIKTSAPPLVEVSQSPVESPEWTPGQRLPAHVLASLPNGRFQVRIGDQILDMNLPKNTQPGENLELIFVSDRPRLTFALPGDLAAVAQNLARPKGSSRGSDNALPLAARDGLFDKPVAARPDGVSGSSTGAETVSRAPGSNAGAETVSRAPGGNAGAETVLRAPGSNAGAQAGATAFTFASNGKPTVSISETARFLGALLEKASGSPGQRSPAQLAQIGGPLLAGPPADTKELSQVLRNALSQSGLFYESHQAQWVTGERPLADLLREPQGKLSKPDPASASRIHRPATEESQVLRQAPVQRDADMQPAAKTAAPTSPMHPDTVQIVQQQLQALDSRQLAWNGQVWQGQTLEWLVEERDARRDNGGADDQATWYTSLRLKMPRLGSVSATLTLLPQGVRINLNAAESGAVAMMSGALGDLRAAFEARGLPLLGIAVERGEKA
jgi:hypothetical protein